jgi:molecular chaperone HtpG
MLQQDRQLRVIAKNIENKIKTELEKMMNENREEYEKFFNVFGTQLKYGTYGEYGMNKDKLQDLLLFYSSNEDKLVSLKEYVRRMKEGQEAIYYASGETIDKIKGLPQVEAIQNKGYEILYLTEGIDEFVLQVILNYEGKKFANVCADNIDVGTEEEKENLKKENEDNKDMLSFMKEAILGEVQDIRFTNRLSKHPVCLTTEGALSIEMQKTLNSQMGAEGEGIKAQTILEINKEHPIAQKLKDLYENDKEELKNYTKILYSQARLIEGLSIENPTEITNMICDLISK